MAAMSEATECGHWSKLTSLPHPAWFRQLAGKPLLGNKHLHLASSEKQGPHMRVFSNTKPALVCPQALLPVPRASVYPPVHISYITSKGRLET